MAGVRRVEYVKEVTHREAFAWDAQDRQSARFNLMRGTPEVDARQVRDALPPADIPIIAYDFGMKFQQHHAPVAAAGVSSAGPSGDHSGRRGVRYKPAGIFLSNGPGDPAGVGYAVETVSELVKSGIPIFGICLGHQILGQALGGKTYKLKFGHRGGNQPVKDLRSGKVEITSQRENYYTGAVTAGEPPGRWYGRGRRSWAWPARSTRRT